VKKKTLKSIIIFIVAALAIFGIIYFLPSLLSFCAFSVWLYMPFIVAYIVSLFANNMANSLQSRFRLPRNVSAILVIILIVGGVGGILIGSVYKIFNELKQIYENFPTIYSNIQSTWTTINIEFNDIVNSMPNNLQASITTIYSQIMDWLTNVVTNTKLWESAGSIAKKLPSILISTITFILSLYFMISDSENINSFFEKHIPDNVQNKLLQFKTELKKYLGGYIKAQLIIMCISFTIILIGLLILRVNYALIIALAIAIFDAIPFFGSGAVFLPWAVINFMSYNIKGGLGCVIIYLCVILMRQFVEPKIIGKNIGMNPLLTLMSMYVGYRVISVGGLILGPLIVTIIISFYRVGLFCNIIKFVNALIYKAKKELLYLKKSFYDEGE